MRTAVAHLAGLVRDNGWPCAVSPELGSWRGPGRKEDPCPFANLAMLKALAQAPEWRDSPAARAGAETLLALWAESRERHPYIFYMGTDFRKLKVPFVWYDLLHVLDVLTQFPWLHDDPRLREMAGLLASKADARGSLHAGVGLAGVGRLGVRAEAGAVALADAARPPDPAALPAGFWRFTNWRSSMTINARYVHTNLIARDWRALARFYQDVLGCVPVPPERDLSGPDMDAGTGIPGAHLRGMHLRLPGRGDDGPTLEIFTYDAFCLSSRRRP